MIRLSKHFINFTKLINTVPCRFYKHINKTNRTINRLKYDELYFTDISTEEVLEDLLRSPLIQRLQFGVNSGYKPSHPKLAMYQAFGYLSCGDEYIFQSLYAFEHMRDLCDTFEHPLSSKWKQFAVKTIKEIEMHYENNTIDQVATLRDPDIEFNKLYLNIND